MQPDISSQKQQYKYREKVTCVYPACTSLRDMAAPMGHVVAESNKYLTRQYNCCSSNAGNRLTKPDRCNCKRQSAIHVYNSFSDGDADRGMKYLSVIANIKIGIL